MPIFRNPVTKLKRDFARASGIPTTRSGRKRKIERSGGGFGVVLFLLLGVVGLIGTNLETPISAPASVQTSTFSEAVPTSPTGLLWDIDSELEFTLDEKRLLRLGALNVLVEESNCLSIYTGYRSTSMEGAYYVTCVARNGNEDFNVFFTPESLETELELSVSEPFPETSSRQLCESSIQEFVISPSTLNIHREMGYSMGLGNNGNREIRQDFSAQNLFGNNLMYQARCLIYPDGTIEFSANKK